MSYSDLTSMVGYQDDSLNNNRQAIRSIQRGLGRNKKFILHKATGASFIVIVYIRIHDEALLVLCEENSPVTGHRWIFLTKDR